MTNITDTDIRDIGYDGKLAPAAYAGRVGVVTLATDLTIEDDLRRMLPPGVGVFTNRVLNANPLTLENLRAMRGDIARAAGGILPRRDADVMIYACTSGSVAIGHDNILQDIRSVHPNAKFTTPLESLLAALEALQVKSISMLTPYIAEINRQMVQHIADGGVQVVNVDGMGFENDMDAADIPPADIARYARRALQSGAEALFISCTALRASVVIDEIEQACGVPVLSSNQVLAWRAARLLGLSSPAGFGRLMQC